VPTWKIELIPEVREEFKRLDGSVKKLVLKIKFSKKVECMKLRLTEEIWKEGNMYVTYCPELDIASCGENVEKAKTNLQEAISITIEETKKMGTFSAFLESCGIEAISDDVMTARKELVGFTPIELSL
jgi:predicted RNase H-like HicB family nuclease